MASTISINNNLVEFTNKDGHIYVSSRDVAEVFEKLHKNVIKELDKILTDQSAKIGADIVKSSYLDDLGRTYKQYLLTKKGLNLYLFNIQGYNDYKMAFLDKFEEMEQALKEASTFPLPQTYREALAALLEQVDRNERLQAQALEDKPKVEFANAVSSSKDCINLGQLAIILKQNGVDIGRNKLFKYLRENGYLVNQRGKEHNRPTQKAMDLGLFEVQERVVVINNESCIKFTVKVTPKGQQYFIDLFLKQAV